MMSFPKNICRVSLYLCAILILCSCQLGYIAESAYYQGKLLRQRVPLKYALKHYKLTDEERQKIELAIQLRKFMKEDLKLSTDDNYSRYVHLDRKYVSYAVNAAPKNELKQYTWNFPIVGSVPYKAYFKKESAIEEEQNLKEKGFDTHLRGVSAYSTLGWFEDPLLSSMLRMKEHSFVNTLIHETVHANLYIKSQSKFNERVASFLGQLGAEAYYKKMNRSQELKTIVEHESHDELLFSKFITQELKQLRDWYKQNKDNPNLLEKRLSQFAEMKTKFKLQVLPKMKTKNYHWFPKKDLNNALLLLLELYNSDFSQLEKLANQHNRDFHKVFAVLKSLEDTENPEKELSHLVSKIASTKQ